MADTKDVVYLALDGLSLERATKLVKEVAGRVCGVKIHDLYDRHGPEVVHTLQDLGVEVWVDHKLHDTPDTVHRRATALLDAGASIITVHASGDVAMIKAATEAAMGLAKVYAVTALTSHTDQRLKQLFGYADSEQLVSGLTSIALCGDADGIVCSPKQVATAAEFSRARRFDIVVPGSRSPGVDHHDQKQVDTPANVLKKGGTHLVIGREVTAASQPAVALEKIEEGIAEC